MKTIVLIHARIAAETNVIENGYLVIKGNNIEAVGDMENCPSLEHADRVINCEQAEWVIPGMIDVHIHGAGGSDVMDGTPNALETMARLLPAEGTTSFLATTTTSPKESIEKALTNAGEFIFAENIPGQAEIIGIHLEGPFINKEKKGAQNEDYILEPNVELFKKWQNLSNNSIKLVTLAPELDGDLALTRHLVETDVIASMGHTSASFEQVKEAVEKGVSHVTHLYNGMSPLHHREPGALGGALLHNELMVELIADGIHSHPEMLKLAFQVKGPEKVVLITDSMRAKCLKNGTYDLGGQDVIVEDGRAVLPTGSLAGSVLKLSEGRRNMQKWTNATIQEMIQMTSVNPAKELGVFDRKGSIKEGKDADIFLIDRQGEVLLTLCRGEIAFEK
ncbi:N-acetylglucosamine-6-phosphate deacetylase [Neobacillus niacini]|uniref:N-acetylglucosamine-6-phosphate deacetylase n=1 Tax=Neobacillus niacini TaxID=86668 RepID=UPI0028673F7D|nr:N-acetylglucosamine-6-phosphate deacetylase [Neobacillus niacini]MDR7079475.1 N-acetylglucosamine-6-phosphate deacetylase [Neobacillus niacini]